jgi:hypothetical protein
LDCNEPARIVKDDSIELPNFHPVRFDKHDRLDGSFLKSSIDNNEPFKEGN